MITKNERQKMSELKNNTRKMSISLYGGNGIDDVALVVEFGIQRKA